MRALLKEINESFGIDQANVSKWILQIDCEKSDITKLWNKINHFGSAAPDNTIPVAFKIVVLDGADNIPPSAQQILKKVLYDQEGKVKYIFICRDQTKLIGHILSRGLAYRTRSMVERDAVGMPSCPKLLHSFSVIVDCLISRKYWIQSRRNSRNFSSN